VSFRSCTGRLARSCGLASSSVRMVFEALGLVGAAREIENQGREVNVLAWQFTPDPTDQNLLRERPGWAG
jgi:hypothetical protein